MAAALAGVNTFG
jgi:plastocyanin